MAVTEHYLLQIGRAHGERALRRPVNDKISRALHVELEICGVGRVVLVEDDLVF